jgi:hypothetical protein
MTEQEKSIVLDAQYAVDNHPEVRTPTLEFKREWAFGNAGLEDERITRAQVDRTIKE